MVELNGIADDFRAVLHASEIRNIDPNTADARAGGIVFPGYATYDWARSDAQLEADRMSLLGRVRDLRPRFELLFRHPTPEVAERHRYAFDPLERWLERPGSDHSIPGDVVSALTDLEEQIAILKAAKMLLPADPIGTRLVVDTNALLETPDVTVYRSLIGSTYRAHFPTVTLGEIDDLKFSGRTPDLREAAAKAGRYLKGLRTNGDITAGVRVAGDVSAVFEHIEPRAEGLPTWLDLSVPDNRLVASALLLQSAHPGSTVYVATGDINLQTKLAATRLPYVEPPSPSPRPTSNPTP